jgi:hypothetical protein
MLRIAAISTRRDGAPSFTTYLHAALWRVVVIRDAKPCWGWSAGGLPDCRFTKGLPVGLVAIQEDQDIPHVIHSGVMRCMAPEALGLSNVTNPKLTL